MVLVFSSCQVGLQWVNAILAGQKTIECVLNIEPIALSLAGDLLMYVVVDTDPLVMSVMQIRAIERYASSRELLEAEGLENCFPGLATIDEGIATCREMYCESSEREHGVLALRIKRCDAGVAKRANIHKVLKKLMN